jgi:deoxyribodipyrimidine photolyase-like uncharacterized protein
MNALYHARISFSMNIKMISPQEVILECNTGMGKET